MAQVRYGMNMRYAAMWELPLCFLAFGALGILAAKMADRWRFTLLAATALIACAFELQSYRTLFAGGTVYDPVAGALAQPLGMYKPVSPQPKSL
jgi:hypothetical protein